MQNSFETRRSSSDRTHPSTNSRRKSKSTRTQDKSLPPVPNSSANEQQPSHAQNQMYLRSDVYQQRSSTRQNFTSQPTVPQFRQSKRWAQAYNLAPMQSDTYTPTMREASFELQRAEFSRPQTTDSARQGRQGRSSSSGDSDSALASRGLCKSLSVPCLGSKGDETDEEAEGEVSDRWLSRTRIQYRQATLKIRHLQIKKSFRKARLTRRFRRKTRIKHKQKLEDLRKRAGFTDNNHLNESENIIDLDAIEARNVAAEVAASPMPSLHDPAKNRRFSQECEDMLEGIGENKNLALFSVPQTSERNTSAGHNRYNLTSKYSTRRVMNDSRDRYEQQSSSNQTPAIFVSSESASREQSAGVRPPTRTTSKGIASLASVVQMQRAGRLPAVNGHRDGSLRTDDNNSTANIKPSTLEKTRINKFSLRIPSPALVISQSQISPGSARSFDTLTVIEDQVRSDTQASIIKKLKQKTAFIVPQPKSDGPSGGPPNRPLPDLPPEDQKQAADDDPGHEMRSKRRQRRLSDPISSNRNAILFDDSVRVISIVPEDLTPMEHEGDSPAPMFVEEEEQQSCVQASAEGQNNNEGMDATNSLGHSTSKSSTYSRDSVRSKRSFTRHDISGLREDRIGNVRNKIKKDLAAQRQHRAGEDDNLPIPPVEPGFSEPKIPPEPVKEIPQPPPDPLDQFPPVPASRPTSLTSASIKHSRGQSRGHGRESSLASSIFQRPGTGHRNHKQLLAKSNIVVLVDTNPITGRFRAGTVSPAPTNGGDSVASSPTKSSKVNRPTKLHELSRDDVLEKRLSRPDFNKQSPKKQKKPRRPSNASKKAVRLSGSNTSHLSSSEDDTPLITLPFSSRPNNPKKRRRWNSSDIIEIKKLNQDLEDYYETIVKQEKKLKDQAEEIQMMVRVLVPISRAHGLKFTIFEKEEDDTIPNNSTSNPTSPLSIERTTHNNTVANTPKKAGNNTGSSPYPSKSWSKRRTRVTASIAGERERQIAATASSIPFANQPERPSSTGNMSNISTATSSSSSVATGGSAASMTDPFEYDLPASASASAPPSASSSKHPRPMPTPTTATAKQAKQVTIATPVNIITINKPRTPYQPSNNNHLRTPTRSSPPPMPLRNAPAIPPDIPRNRPRTREGGIFTLSPKQARKSPSQQQRHHHRNASSATTTTSQFQTFQHYDSNENNNDINERAGKEEAEGEGDEYQRLSVNHVLNRTDRMDRVIDLLRFYE